MPISRVLEPEVMAGAEEAGEYDEMDFSVTDQLFAERAAELVGDALAGEARCIVDIGSGNAKIPLAMCALLPPGAAVCAVEMSASMLAVAARNRARAGVAAHRLHLISGDAKQLPFPAGSIGMVTSNSLVHHIPDPRAVFLEVARIARSGGPILIRDLIRPDSEAALELILDTHAAQASPLQRTLFADSLHAALTVAEVRTLLDECGLADVAVSQITDRHWSAERA
jgi:ubiquinone/menaquinone biosynthesis C-methylase UbiE